MIKLYLSKSVGFFFSGSVALYPSKHTESNPLTLDLSSLTKDEVLGLNRGIKTSVVTLLEGEEEFRTKVDSYDCKPKEDVAEVVEDSIEDTTTEEKVETQAKPARTTRARQTKAKAATETK